LRAVVIHPRRWLSSELSSRDEAEIRLYLMLPAKASRVIDRGHEGRRRDQFHAGERPQALHARIRVSDLLDHLVRVCELLIDGPHHRQQRRDLREQAAR
jgi:hypothetical protein